MKSNVMIVLTALAAFGLAGSCSENDNTVQDMTPKTIKLTAEAPQAIASSNNFGIDLFKKVAEEENLNLMLSPLSASAALTMLLNGCGGDTYTQLQGTLNYPSGMTIGDINEAYKSLVEQLLNADPKVKLALANAIFYRTGFTVKDPFLAVMDNDYNAEIKGLDFSTPSALTTINKWASDNTNKKIPRCWTILTEMR
jgi:serpin B